MASSRALRVPSLLLAVILLAACGGVAGTPQVIVPTAPAISVDITSDSCPSVEITPGTQIIWTNKDNVEHIVRVKRADSDDILVDLGTLGAGESGAYTFVESGAYLYWCSQDQSTPGTITVKPGG